MSTLPPPDETPANESESDSFVERIAVAVVLDRSRVLVGRRPLGVSMAGYAEFPGGKIEADETPDQAATRECLEETGVQVSAHETLNVMRHATEAGSREIHFIHCKLLGGNVVRGSFEWVPLTRMGAYRFPPANEEILRVLSRMADRLS